MRGSVDEEHDVFALLCLHLGIHLRVAAARKKAATYSDEPSLKEAMRFTERNGWRLCKMS